MLWEKLSQILGKFEGKKKIVHKLGKISKVQIGERTYFLIKNYEKENQVPDRHKVPNKCMNLALKYFFK